MNKKIFFFDIDGTLVDDNKELPQSTIDSVKALQDKGHFVAIATGRPPFMFKDIRDQLGITTFVSMNGQYVVHDDEVIYTNPLNEEELNRLKLISTDQKHPLVFMNGQGWEASVNESERVIDALKTFNVDEVGLPVKPKVFEAGERYQVLLFCEAHEEPSYVETLKQFDFIRWHDYSVDVLPKGGSKAAGIKVLLDKLSIDLQDAYAYGDGLNDIKMMEFIPNSVAMGNAVEPLKKVAKYVTKNVDDDGIQHSLKELGIL